MFPRAEIRQSPWVLADRITARKLRGTDSALLGRVGNIDRHSSAARYSSDKEAYCYILCSSQTVLFLWPSLSTTEIQQVDHSDPHGVEWI